MRTKFTQTTNGVTLNYTGENGDNVERCFFVSGNNPHGSYVREWTERGEARLVCERLSQLGATLISTHDGLMTLIKREWNAARRADRMERA